jgi:Uma2 family endonuclease
MGEILERPRAPARHRLDVDAYYKMAEADILTHSDRVELIDGEIIDMVAIGSPHAAILMLLRPRPDDYRASHPGATDVLLLIEVSESSLAYDRTAKLALYAKFAVAEVWIVDVSGAAIEIYREPAGDAYARRERLTSGLLAPVLAPSVTIDVGALLK